MSKDRLLSEKEILAEVTKWRKERNDELITYEAYQQVIVKAQDLKSVSARDKEWVGWVEKLEHEQTIIHDRVGIPVHIFEQMLAERKKEIGL